MGTSSYKSFQIGQIFSGRLNRGPFLVFSLASLVFAPLNFLETQNMLYQVLVLAAVIPMTVLSIGVTVRRMHDCGQSAWWLLLFLVPLANLVYYIYLFFKPSVKGTNKYGPEPSYERPLVETILNRQPA